MRVSVFVVGVRFFFFGDWLMTTQRACFVYIARQYPGLSLPHQITQKQKLLLYFFAGAGVGCAAAMDAPAAPAPDGTAPGAGDVEESFEPLAAPGSAWFAI